MRDSLQVSGFLDSGHFCKITQVPKEPDIDVIAGIFVYLLIFVLLVQFSFVLIIQKRSEPWINLTSYHTDSDRVPWFSF